MAVEKLSLGQAIDAIIKALQGLDEKTRANAIAAACTQLGVESPAVERRTPPPPGEAKGAGQGAPTVVKDIRQLTEEKKPESTVEMACLVAYYLMNIALPPEKKDIVTNGDMEKYFVQGNYPLRKHIKDLLGDAKSAGYFDSVGRGKYRLNPVGHNLVAHSLPRKTKS
jgi:hypothetical protein